jgi:hypothetical protein
MLPATQGKKGSDEESVEARKRQCIYFIYSPSNYSSSGVLFLKEYKGADYYFLCFRIDSNCLCIAVAS